MIRKGNWKYLYFTAYGEALFNLENDPGEKDNLAAEPRFTEVRDEMRATLFGLVNPDSITAAAFRKQKFMLDTLVNNRSELELRNVLKGRLGEGQARMMAARLKGRY